MERRKKTWRDVMRHEALWYDARCFVMRSQGLNTYREFDHTWATGYPLTRT